MITLKEFCTQEGIGSISNVRKNTNGYPFVTVLRGTDAENIYFSKKAALKVADADPIKGIAKDLFVVNTINSAGEERLKLTFTGEDYASVEDLF